jgi:hypothetical protein
MVKNIEAYQENRSQTSPQEVREKYEQAVLQVLTIQHTIAQQTVIGHFTAERVWRIYAEYEPDYAELSFDRVADLVYRLWRISISPSMANKSMFVEGLIVDQVDRDILAVLVLLNFFRTPQSLLKKHSNGDFSQPQSTAAIFNKIKAVVKLGDAAEAVEAGANIYINRFKQENKQHQSIVRVLPGGKFERVKKYRDIFTDTVMVRHLAGQQAILNFFDQTLSKDIGLSFNRLDREKMVQRFFDALYFLTRKELKGLMTQQEEGAEYLMGIDLSELMPLEALKAEVLKRIFNV